MANDRRPLTGDAWAGIVALAAFAIAVGSELLVRTACALTGTEHPAEMAIFALIDRSFTPTGTQWAIMGFLLAVVLSAVAVVVWQFRKRKTRTRRRGDEKAQYLGGKASHSAVRRKNVESKARRLYGDDRADELAKAHPGFFLGRDVKSGEELFGSFEDVATYIAGPRTGKTSSIAVPMIVDSPGAVLATSNKRDLVDLTRGMREQVGRCFIFDPSQITKGQANVAWDPLSFLRATEGFDGSLIARSRQLSQAFGDAGRAGGDDSARGFDTFFDGGGDDLRANMMAAAALKKDGTLKDVFLWLSQENNDEPYNILRNAGYVSAGKALLSKMNLPPETKGGLFACARQGLDFVEDEAVDRYYLPASGEDALDLFDPVAFVKSTDTLYSMSKDGSMLSPLVSALTAVVCYAGEYAAEDNGGRLAVPLMVVLDEAANVCPWRQLPSLYSHYGSKGICIQAVLQSWSQGKGVWGDTGMNKLWGASNIAMYLGGVKEEQFLDKLSKLIGTRPVDKRSVSYADGRRTYSTNYASQREAIAPVEDLASLPDSRAWLFASKSKPVLVELVPFYRQPYADQIAASQAKYGQAA